MKIIIPVKTNSSRVKNKNFRPFHNGQSLFDIKIQQLLRNGVSATDIFVSCDDETIGQMAVGMGLNFMLREHKYTLDTASESEWLGAVFRQLPDSEDDIAVIRVTQPLFSDFSWAFKEWDIAKQEGYDSFDVTIPYRHHTVDDAGKPVNYQFGMWHQYSQYLPKWHQLGGMCSIVKREIGLQFNYLIGRKFKCVDTETASVDIDTEQDFKIAQLLYSVQNSD